MGEHVGTETSSELKKTEEGGTTRYGTYVNVMEQNTAKSAIEQNYRQGSEVPRPS